VVLPRRSVELLIALVESSIGRLDILDREDNRELQILQQCREQLKGAFDEGTLLKELALRAEAARCVH